MTSDKMSSEMVYVEYSKIEMLRYLSIYTFYGLCQLEEEFDITAAVILIELRKRMAEYKYDYDKILLNIFDELTKELTEEYEKTEE